MRIQTIFIILTVVFGHTLIAQKSSGPMIDSKQKNKITVLLNEDFVKKYQLEGKTPTTMRLTEEFTMRSEPSCESSITKVVIPADSIINGYKYFPKNQCWAAQYHGQWGFVPSSEVFPVSKHTMNINKYDIAPKLRSRVKQKYPKEAEKKGITGTVSLKIFIDKKGRVTKTKIIKGVPELNQAAIDAIKDAKFKPAIYKQKAIGVWIPISFDFE